MKQQYFTGIDIGSDTTRVVVTTGASDGQHPKIVATGLSKTRGVRHGYIVNKEDVFGSLMEAIRMAEKELGTRIKSASITINGTGIESVYAQGGAVTSRADSIISKLDIDNAIQEAESQIDLKNKVILHAFPLVFKIDGKELPTRPDGIYGLKLEVKVLFITCFKQHLDDALAVMDAANIKVLSFIANPLAAHRILLTDMQKNFGCVLIDIGAETVSISVYENGTPTITHVLSLGSLDITKDIALGLTISPEEAEGIKLGTLNFQSVPKRKIDEIVEARYSDIFELIDRYLKKIGRSGLLPSGAIIIGGGSLAPALENPAKNILKIPVRLGHVDIPSVKGPIKDPRFILAYSVAINNEQNNFKSSKKRNSPSNNYEGEGFWSFIKDFLKQLMP